MLLGDEEGGGGPGHAGELETELGVVRRPASYPIFIITINMIIIFCQH